MELRHLESFVAVVRHGGFTRAAEALHTAQPAVSTHVQRLEAELGTPLLARTTRTVRLTRAGELLLRRAERALGELDGARGEIDRLGGVLGGRVRIGAIQALEPLDLPAVLAGFVRHHPGVELRLTSGPGRVLVDDLLDGRIDLALAPVPADPPRSLAVETLFREELVLVTARDHRCAPRRELGMADVADEPFVCLPEGSGLRRLLDDAARAAGTRVSVPFECTNLDRLRALVAHGLGVALVARSVAERPGPPVAVHSLTPDPIDRPVAMIRRLSDLEPAVAACASALREAAAGLTPATGGPTG